MITSTRPKIGARLTERRHRHRGDGAALPGRGGVESTHVNRGRSEHDLASSG